MIVTTVCPREIVPRGGPLFSLKRRGDRLQGQFLWDRRYFQKKNRYFGQHSVSTVDCFDSYLAVQNTQISRNPLSQPHQKFTFKLPFHVKRFSHTYATHSNGVFHHELLPYVYQIKAKDWWVLTTELILYSSFLVHNSY